jgi:hypothetical protein
MGWGWKAGGVVPFRRASDARDEEIALRMVVDRTAKAVRHGSILILVLEKSAPSFVEALIR